MASEMRLVPGRNAAGGQIRAWRDDDRVSRRDAAWELIDNALDARADEIVVAWGQNSFEIRDNGLGCDDPSIILDPGQSRPRGDWIRTGGFGVGAKFSLVRLSRGWVVEASSISDGVMRSCRGHYGEMIARDAFFYGQSDPAPAPSGRRGTRVKCTNPKGVLSPPRDVESFMEDVGWNYRDALLRGVRIRLVINGREHVAAPASLPDLLVSRTFEGEHDGVPLRVLCGYTPKGEPNPRSGFTFYREGIDRPLLTTSRPAAGKCSEALFARVDLLGDFRGVNPTKSGFAADADSLYEYVGKLCAPVIDAADSHGMSRQMSDLSSKLSESLGSILPQPYVKGRRDRKPPGEGKPGSVMPKDTGRKHLQFEKHQAGSAGWPRGEKGKKNAFGGVQCKPADCMVESFKTEVFKEDGQWKVVVKFNPSREPTSRYLNKKEQVGRKDYEALFDICLYSLAGYLCSEGREHQHLFGVEDYENPQWVFDALMDRRRGEGAAKAVAAC